MCYKTLHVPAASPFPRVLSSNSLLHLPYFAQTKPELHWLVIVEFNPNDHLTVCFYMLNAEWYETRFLQSAF